MKIQIEDKYHATGTHFQNTLSGQMIDSVRSPVNPGDTFGLVGKITRKQGFHPAREVYDMLWNLFWENR